MSKHEHDTDGLALERQVRIGDYIVTLETEKCTCGVQMGTREIGREPAWPKSK